jgi:predicted transposase/invertase (TIGR01784 family)
VLPELDDGELMSSDNPIDIVLYAAKHASRKAKELQKYNYLRTAVDMLARRGWGMDDKRRLMLFVERVTNLRDEGLKAQFREYQEQLDREGKIVYVSIAEEYYTKKGIEKGIEKGKLEGKLEGRLEGKLEVARNLLARGVSPDIIAESAGLPVEKIRELMN